MKIRSLLLGAVAAVGLLGTAGAVRVTYGANYQSRAEFTGGTAQPAVQRASLPEAAVVRRRREAGWRRIARRYWDGKNRTPGDRAHKRMKHRRASGRAA